mmetsp:Transcript_23350/g.40953  ORF Transcript_23350/g.40953 Transcript_23350/m.40953 type:complete len:234 (-) Transcript_23350:187-888(-)
MTFKSPHGPFSTTILLLLSLLLTTTICYAEKLVKPASVYLEQKNDAQQVLLIETTNNGTVIDVLESVCGLDTYYGTSAIVLGVNRTVEPDATALGAFTQGEIMTVCNMLYFKTYEKEWTEGCDGDADPGRRMERWCGYVYLTPGMEIRDPYVLAAGVRSFEEVDGSVCEEAGRRECPTYVGTGGDGSEDGESVGDDDGLGSEKDGGKKSGARASSLGCSGVIALLSVVALWRV